MDQFNFYYDPQRQGFDTNLWKQLSGTTAVVGTKLRFSADAAIMYSDIFRGFLEMALNVPTPANATLTGANTATAVVATWEAVTDGEFAITIDGVAYDITGLDFTAAGSMAAIAAIIQEALNDAANVDYITVAWATNHFVITARTQVSVTSAVSGGSGTDISGAGATTFLDGETGVGTAVDGSSKKFGFTQLSKGVSAYFELRGATLFCVTSNGTDTQETELTWNTDFTGVEKVYTVDWTGHGVVFKIDGGRVAFHETVVPTSPMSPYISNTDSDNLDMGYLQVKEIETYL